MIALHAVGGTATRVLTVALPRPTQYWRVWYWPVLGLVSQSILPPQL